LKKIIALSEINYYFL